MEGHHDDKQVAVGENPKHPPPTLYPANQKHVY